jgi:hypothetical protein
VSIDLHTDSHGISASSSLSRLALATLASRPKSSIQSLPRLSANSWRDTKIGPFSAATAAPLADRLFADRDAVKPWREFFLGFLWWFLAQLCDLGEAYLRQFPVVANSSST